MEGKVEGKYILDDLIMSGMRMETGVYIMIWREIEIVGL
jgi:hypothetical protein